MNESRRELHASLEFVVVTSSFWRLHSSRPLPPSHRRLYSWVVPCTDWLGVQSLATGWSHRLILLLVMVQRASTCRTLWQRGNMYVCVCRKSKTSILKGEGRHALVFEELQPCTQYAIMPGSAMSKAINGLRPLWPHRWRGASPSLSPYCQITLGSQSRFCSAVSVEFLIAAAAAAVCWASIWFWSVRYRRVSHRIRLTTRRRHATICDD